MTTIDIEGKKINVGGFSPNITYTVSVNKTLYEITMGSQNEVKSVQKKQIGGNPKGPSQNVQSIKGKNVTISQTGQGNQRISGVKYEGSVNLSQTSTRETEKKRFGSSVFDFNIPMETPEGEKVGLVKLQKVKTVSTENINTKNVKVNVLEQTSINTTMDKKVIESGMNFYK